jgi:regulator of RNase E activity RraA
VLGDYDGIVCVPRHDALSVLQAAQAKHQAEQAQMAAIRQRTVDRSWIDKELIRLGCEFL